MEIKDFEQALKRLEKIVSTLEAGDLPLEEALKLFEEGMTLSQSCGKQLDEAERKVEILLKKSDGSFSEKAFEPEDTESEDV